MFETQFIRTALKKPKYSWENQSINDLAGLHIPDGILGRNRSLLRADINGQWAKWFVEGIADPRAYIGKDNTYPFIFSDVLQAISNRFPGCTKIEARELSSVVAKVVQRLVYVFRKDRERLSASKNERMLFIELAGGEPRCWICGGKFSNVAIDNFIYQKKIEIPKPLLIDILKPKGLNQRDLSIEIDHIVSHAHGGGVEGNLKLSCGWCNRHKGAFNSIYDVDGYPKPAAPNQLGITTLPLPFWSVRMLSTKRHCEHLDGCSASVDSDEMTIAPINDKGAINPSNLKITCYKHDPFLSIRLQSVNTVRKIWKLRPEHCS